jgi:hypothetical protein
MRAANVGRDAMLHDPPGRRPARTGGFDAPAEFLTFLWWKSGSGIRRRRPEIPLRPTRSNDLQFSKQLRVAM